jgi:hypothetical protein
MSIGNSQSQQQVIVVIYQKLEHHITNRLID